MVNTPARVDTPARRLPSRVRRALLAATLASGSAEVVDFVLPLYVAVAVDAAPSQVGLLLAVEILLSLLVRPIAGYLADRYERTVVAAGGAALYGIACLGYAQATGIGAGYVAAAVSGAGGALLWVALRAVAGQAHAADDQVFARLLVAESTGRWAIFVPAIVLLGFAGYRPVFLAAASCCAVACVVLLAAPRRRTGAGPEPLAAGRVPTRPADLPRRYGLARRLRPMLLAVAVTAAAEAAVGLLLLLHLQQGFGLTPVQIALVFLPGAVAMSTLPRPLQRLVRRCGRRRTLTVASMASAAFAAGLAVAPHPVAIAALWVFAATAWAVTLPVQQAVIAEASGDSHLGRGMSRYEAAALAGGLLGVLGAGVLYDVSSWQWACLVAAGVLLAGAVAVPAAVDAVAPAAADGSAADGSAVSPAEPPTRRPGGRFRTRRDPRPGS